MPSADGYLDLSMRGSFCLVSMRAVGPSFLSMAICQAMAVSLASAGLITQRFGISLKELSCSTGWWVGPSSPRPMESWVKTYMT